MIFNSRLIAREAADSQRQLTKVGLADQMVDHGTKESTSDCTSESRACIGRCSLLAFTFEDLRDIFRVNMYTDGCQTRTYCFNLICVSNLF